MSRCLVTGGAGFVGSHVAENLRDAGHEVVVLDDLSGGFLRNVPDGVQFVKGSICDAPLVDHVFKTRQPMFVWHLAAYAAEGLSPFIRGFNYMNNVVGSAHVTNACINYGVKCLTFTSSIAVYGDGPPHGHPLPFTEVMMPSPVDPYGIAKYAVELDLLAAHLQFGLDYIIFRPHNIYGERQNIADKYRNVIGIFMNQIMRGEPMTIFGDGAQTRAFSYIGDVAPVIAGAPFVSNARNLTYNIGGEQTYTVNELAGCVAAVIGDLRAALVHAPARREAQHAYCDHRRAKQLLGYHDATTLEAGLMKMAAWAKRRGPQQTTPFAAIEIEKNLPESWV